MANKILESLLKFYFAHVNDVFGGIPSSFESRDQRDNLKT